MRQEVLFSAAEFFGVLFEELGGKQCNEQTLDILLRLKAEESQALGY
ncbi:hypothetical protein [Halovenus salina]|uniref:Uncharacterized protein n=1 Tax=Halovenus salina TaxID=1510225 RepID=A0ABD5W4T8_9EURY|nr:hypothetical protein [Halovenus salina]